MMKLSGNNIISDEDINITNKNLIGEKLSDILEKQQNDIEKLKSNVKWLYKYGGVGSGSGNGNGGGTSALSWSIFSTIDGIQVKNDKTIGLNGEKSYPLFIKINQPQGAVFRVTVTYNYEDRNSIETSIGNRSINFILDINNGYEALYNLNFNCNGFITIKVTNNITAEDKQIRAGYIIEPYKVSYSLINNSGVVYSSDEIFTEFVKNNGLKLKYKCNIDVEYESAKIIFQYETVNSTEIKILRDVSLNGATNEGTIDLGDIATEDNLGYISIDASLIIDDTLQKKDSKSFSLLSSNLYLSVVPEVGNIYGTNIDENTENIYEFSPGIVTINIRPYYGTRYGDSCAIYYLYGKNTDEGNTNISPQQYNTTLGSRKSIKIFCSTGGIYFLKVRLIYNSDTYPSENDYKTYYFKVKEPVASLDWYSVVSSTSNEICRNFWQVGGGNNVTLEFSEKLGIETYQNTISSEKLTFDNIAVPSFENAAVWAADLVINIGLQYSEINDILSPLFTLTTKNDSGGNKDFIKIYQNKIEFTKTSDSIKYFLQKERDINISSPDKYHLLSFVLQYKTFSNNFPYYEVLVYIDGILESGYNSFITNNDLINTFTIEKFNGYINLIDISYIKRPAPTSSEASTSVNEDLVAYNNYLCYYNNILYIDDSENFYNTDKYNVFSIVGDSSPDFSYEKDCIRCNQNFIYNIARVVKIPTILLSATKTPLFNKETCNRNLEGEQTTLKSNVTVSWSNGKGGDIQELQSPTNTIFNIEIQGTSTRSYKCKNWELSLVNTDIGSDNIYLFSPNFDKNDPSTFLPERSFTLKADVVDSSHSNNTSIGKFVNKITNKFYTGADNLLSGYVKNCLEGFPCLVFMGFTDSDTQITDYYFEGLYNFNLGRASHHNLNYKNNNVFIKDGVINIRDAGEGFTFYEVHKNDENFKDGLVVAEIQNNSPYFDFSQYDPTILFSQRDNGKELYMFGDLVEGNNISKEIAQQNIQKLVKNVSLSGGYIFDTLGKSYNSDTDDGGYITNSYNKTGILNTKENSEQIDENKKKKYPLNEVPNYRYQYEKVLGTDGTDKFEYKSSIEAGKETDLQGLIITNEENQNKKPLVNFRSLSEYYTICMAFGLVDSVQKNMNIKTWTAMPNPNEGDNTTTWYIAFYDMDTCLGIDNSGQDVEYFAFSDYWDDNINSNESQENLELNEITVYRDYSPGSDSTRVFYDTPSSYLFAVAKYSRIDRIIGDRSDIQDFPQELWARWRSLPRDSENDSTVGCLKDAHYFVDNYFSNNLKSVPEILINFNYRNKYFIKNEDESISYNTTNFEKFQGTRIAKVIDWLDGRLHILDAYFNLCRSTSNIQYYETTGNNIVLYSNRMINGTVLAEPTYTDKNNYNLLSNKDIFILQDIFSNEESSTNATVKIQETIKAKKLSPLFLNTPSRVNRFLIPDDKNSYIFSFETNGKEVVSYYGSGAWTFLNSIDGFKYKTLKISSRYLENLRGVSDSSTTVISSIDMPNLREIELTGKNYSGTISNVEGESDKFLNLNKIDISNSKINLDLNSSSCKEIIFNKINSSYIKILNCSYLNNIEFSNINVSDLYISPYPINLLTTEEGLVIKENTITNITISNETDTSEYEHRSKITIENEVYLETLTISGINEIIIKHCPKLHQITINNVTGIGDKTTTIVIIDIGTNPPNGRKVKVNSNDEGTIDLSSLTSLERLTIKRVSQFHTCIVRSSDLKLYGQIANDSSNISMEDEGGDFFGNINFQYLDTGDTPVEIVTGKKLFAGCNKFTLKQNNDGDYSKLKISEDCGNISYILAGQGRIGTTRDPIGGKGVLTLDDIKYFIENVIKNENNISNIDYAFSSNLISIGGSAHTQRLADINKLKKVTSAVRTFSINDISYYDNVLYNIGELSSSININGYCQNSSLSSANITAKVNYLSNIIDKISDIGQTTNWGTNTYRQVTNIKFIKEDSTSYGSETFYIKDIFKKDSNDTNSYSNIEKIGGYNIVNQNISFKDAFKSLPSLSEISDSFNYVSTNPGSKRIDLDRLFYYNDNITTVYHSFIGSGDNDNPANLYTMFDWDKNSFKSIVNVGLITTNDENRNERFTLKKYITKEKYEELVDKLLRNNSISRINYIFNNCYLLLPSNPLLNQKDLILKFKKKDDDSINTNITNFNVTFYNFKQVFIDDYRSESDILDEVKELDFNNTDLINGTISYVDSNEYQNINLFALLNSPNFSYPIILDKDFFKYLPSIKQFYRTFENIKLGSNLPLNFFNKRIKKEISSNIYIKNINDVLIPGKFTYYDYRREITNFYKTFYEVEWSKYLNDEGTQEINYNTINENGSYYSSPNSFNYDYINDNLDNIIKPAYYNKFEYFDDNSGDTVVVYNGDLYNSDGSIIPSFNLGPGTEISDILNNNLGSYSQTAKISEDRSLDNVELEDESVAKKSLIIAPDLLYGITTTTGNSSDSVTGYTINYILCGSTKYKRNLEGMMPPNFFKNCKNCQFKNAFKNIKLIPRYYDEIEEISDSGSESKTILNKIYTFIPDYFTNITNLSSGYFNFLMILPGNEFTETSDNIIKEKYFIFSPNSLPRGLTSLEGSLPTISGKNNENTFDHAPEGSSHNINTQLYGSKNYYNIMFSINTTNEDDTIIKVLDEGIDLSKYTEFRGSNLVTEKLSAFLVGKIFNTNNNKIRKIKLDDKKYLVSSFNNNGSLQAGANNVINKYLILPTADVTAEIISTSRIIKFTVSSDLYLSNSNFEDSSSPNIYKYYKYNNRKVIIRTD